MGTHPIFESDFDCLTEIKGNRVLPVMSNYPNQSPPDYNAATKNTYDERTYLPEAADTAGIQSAGFEDNNVRRVFIRKVYTVLTIQLAFTAGMIAIFTQVDAVKDALTQGNSGLGLGVMVTSNVFFIFFYLLLVCPCCNFQKKYPCNIICLLLLTLAMSCMAGSIGAFYSARGMDKALMLAGGTTVMVVATVTGLTFWSKFDITKFWQLFLILPIVTLFAFIFVMISGYNDVAIICYSALGVIAFTFYLAFDTRMIIGGGRFSYGPDDWIEAVVQLYVDIVQIFLYLLQIFGRTD